PDLDTQLILVDTYGLVCSPNHPLASLPAPIAWSNLAPHVMVSLQKSSGVRANVELHPRVPARCKQPLYEVGSMSSLHPLLVRGLGYAALPVLAAQPLVSAGLRYVPLFKPTVRRRLYIVTKRGRSLSPAAAVLLETMTGAVQRLPAIDGLSIRPVKGDARA
ncbi:MAG TPA: LysR substrate-binding domain-containing protein, partial [Burkholderiaceae bacterium]